MAGYLNLPEKTDEAFTPDGWLRTGDLGRIDAAGNLRLIGRSHEMFKSGGYNVYPREVEQVLESMAGVQYAAVVPRPDERWGEVGVAFVQGSDDLDVQTIRSEAKKGLANYKVPKQFVFRELPRLHNHKIDKVRLRDEAATAHLPHGAQENA